MSRPLVVVGGKHVAMAISDTEFTDGRRQYPRGELRTWLDEMRPDAGLSPDVLTELGRAWVPRRSIEVLARPRPPATARPVRQRATPRGQLAFSWWRQ